MPQSSNTAIRSFAEISRTAERDLPRLFEVWESSVRASHLFLKESDIQSLIPLVKSELAAFSPIHCLRADDGRPFAMLGVARTNIEMLFVHADHRSKGAGRLLTGFAIQALGARSVDVNEQNAAAITFYSRLGFRIVSRSSLDSNGSPFPILHMSLLESPEYDSYSGQAAMRTDTVVLLDEAQCEELDTFLVDRIYEFNSQATGCFDGKLLGASIRNGASEVIAGLSGHTWGGCCEISNLWVDERHRGQGLGRALTRAAEAEARRRGCTQVTLLTHSFQAPQFYERLGYERKYAIEGRPKGHSDIVFVKVLPEVSQRDATDDAAH